MQLAPRDELMTFGEVSRLVHPDDIKLYEVAAQLADATANAIDHEFRMLHAGGKWVWLRARCEMVRQATEPGLHLIGIAVDITEQKSLVERTAAADLRLRDAIETIPEAFVLWDQENRLVLCNSNFQQLHNLPDDAIVSGTSYEDVVAAGRKHVIRTKLSSDGPVIPGARTFEAQLDDGQLDRGRARHQRRVPVCGSAARHDAPAAVLAQLAGHSRRDGPPAHRNLDGHGAVQPDGSRPFGLA